MLTMVLSEAENISYGNAKRESPPHQEDEDQTTKDTPFSPMSGQSSLLSLTLNEIQLKRGKSFGSMNMDEFLANIWSTEENQFPSQPNQNVKPANDNGGGGGGNGQLPSLARQGSFSIPAPLCKKTVDEVWFEIQKEDQPQHQNSNNDAAHQPPQSQQTLGEITLEDFLIKAGVVQEAPQGSSLQLKTAPTPPSVNAFLDINFGMGHVMGLGYQNVGNHLSSGNGFTAYQMFPSGKGYDNAQNDKPQTMIELASQPNKKRIIDGPLEVVVERRQRRMIKNRESAARSRARKQAYTVELELELNQLKEENAKLKQTVEEIEQKRKEEVMRRKSSATTQKKVDKLRSIRRTVSLSW